MKLFPKGAWGYLVLLVLLFSIAALATKSVVDFATERFYFSGFERAVQEFSLAIWALTMGLMFLAGGLGLWAVSLTAEYESRHRIAGIVNRMNYLSDGLLALDYEGRVRGANPAACKLALVQAAIGKKDTINSIFPFLTEENTRRLLNPSTPSEIESEYFDPAGLRMLRLRSQPAEGLVLVFVSDITEMHAANIRQQQTARLQLLGRIAAGVAHDFSNILSAISGHAALMQRFSDDKRSLNDSIAVINDETHRGVRLSRQLLVLSRSSDFDGQSSNNPAENVREAVELLRVALSSAWTVETDAEGIFPAVRLSPARIVQIILNLGLLAADALKKPGKIAIYLKKPDDLSRDSRRFAAIIISASADLPSATEVRHWRTEAGSEPGPALSTVSPQAVAPPLQSAAMGMVDTTGMIPSVVRTFIEEAGGRLDELYAGSNKILYRICLPFVSEASKSDLAPLKSVSARPESKIPSRAPERPDSKRDRDDARKPRPDAGRPWPGRQWNILLASSDARLAWLEKALIDLGAVVEKKVAIDTALGAIDQERKPDVIIADKQLFGDVANGILKAVRKLCPASGIIIISPNPEEEELRTERGFIFLEPHSSEETWLNAVLSSRQLAPRSAPGLQPPHSLASAKPDRNGESAEPSASDAAGVAARQSTTARLGEAFGGARAAPQRPAKPGSRAPQK